MSQERSCFMAISSWIPILPESCLFIALSHTLALYFCTPPSFEKNTIFLRGALARVTARIRNAQWYKMPLVLVSGKRAKITAKSNAKVAVSMLQHQATMPAGHHDILIHVSHGSGLPFVAMEPHCRPGPVCPAWYDAPTSTPPCRWRRCSRWRCVNLRISRSWDLAWCDTSLAVSL